MSWSYPTHRALLDQHDILSFDDDLEARARVQAYTRQHSDFMRSRRVAEKRLTEIRWKELVDKTNARFDPPVGADTVLSKTGKPLPVSDDLALKTRAAMGIIPYEHVHPNPYAAEAGPPPDDAFDGQGDTYG